MAESNEPITPKRHARKVREKLATQKKRHRDKIREKRGAEKRRVVCKNCTAVLVCETSVAKRGRNVKKRSHFVGNPDLFFHVVVCNHCKRWYVDFPGIGKVEVPEYCKIVMAVKETCDEARENSYYYGTKCGCVSSSPNTKPKRKRKQWRNINRLAHTGRK